VKLKAYASQECKSIIYIYIYIYKYIYIYIDKIIFLSLLSIHLLLCTNPV